MTEMIRCPWCLGSQSYQDYHDKQWGKPIKEDKLLFKFLLLEGQQAGLSWSTILNKWDALCEAYDDFDPEKLIHYTEEKEAALLQDKGIIRNRLKIKAAKKNAEAYFKLLETESSFSHYLWAFVDNEPIVNHWERIEEVPASTFLSETLSKDLKKRGFTFVGPTIIYAFMQAVGMVNDHIEACHFKYK